MRVRLSSTIYSLEGLGETVPAFADFCSVNIGPEKDNYYSIEILPLSPAVDDELLTSEFLNYLLAVSIQNHLNDHLNYK
jgi:hypothetical protein